VIFIPVAVPIAAITGRGVGAILGAGIPRLDGDPGEYDRVANAVAALITVLHAIRDAARSVIFIPVAVPIAAKTVPGVGTIFGAAIPVLSRVANEVAALITDTGCII